MIVTILALLFILALFVPEFFVLFVKLLPILILISISVGMGTLTWVINNAKGYNGGFWWGAGLTIIGLVVVLLRPTIQAQTNVPGGGRPVYLANPGAWYCPACGRSHAVYEYSCICGMEKGKVRKDFVFEEFQPEARVVEQQ